MTLKQIISEMLQRIKKVADGDTVMMIDLSIIFPDDKKAHQLIYTDERIANDDDIIGKIGYLKEWKAEK